MSKMSTEHLKRCIPNLKEPYLIKNQLNWELLKWSLQDWTRVLKTEQLSFRVGKKSFTKEPQWERTTSTMQTTFEEFLSFAKTNSDSWMYFDYKYLKEWFSNIPEIRNNIKWDMFGFPELSSEDSTIWIGSAGAHTPCHVDTYGCNLIAQIYGRKQWILCPPGEDLKATRVPYEESSIYSKLNFFSPNVEHFKGVKNCRRVILEAGDVLFVPHKWWHYVENLDTAISINVWIPQSSDDEERVKESLVQFFISQMLKNTDKEIRDIILNPNSDEDVANMTLHDSWDLISKCKSVLQEPNRNAPPNLETVETNSMPFLEKIPILSPTEMDQFLQDQRNRFKNEETRSERNDVEEFVDLIDAFVHPETISLVKSRLKM